MQTKTDIIITSELASIIKSERQKRKISAKDLSNYIGKSDAYISTLERGNIKKIDDKTFINILSKISNLSDKELEEYINSILAETFFQLGLNNTELKKQEWLLQLGLIVRQIPIPNAVVDFIKGSLEELNKTDIDLIRKINQNTHLENKHEFENNKLYVDDNGSWSYKFKLDDDVISNILNKRYYTCNYIIMLGIIYNIYLLKGEDDKTASEKAELFLKSNEFYNLKEIVKDKQQYINKEIDENILEEYSFKMPTYEREFEQSLNTIKNYITELKNFKINTAYEVVKTVEANIKYDKEFMNVIYSICFANSFKDLDRNDKQEFLNGLRDLITNTLEKKGKN